MELARAVGIVTLAAALAACEVRDRPLGPLAPHVVLIVADDLGWGEVGFHGGAVPTPNIDRLAGEGVALERMYAQPMCSATRAALLTGRDPIRYGMGRAVITPWRDFGLPPEERTLAEALPQRRYPHRAAFGKWHLGHRARRWHPLRQGFTEFRGHYNGAIDHFAHLRDGERDWHADYEPLREEGYATRLEAAAAAQFIERRARTDRLFCYVALSAAHAPFQAPPETLARFAHLAEPDGTVGVRQARAAMIAELDGAVGVVLAALETSGIADDTLVWFVGDNGAGPEQPDANAPWRGHKGTLYEGALRVPAIVRWREFVAGGRRESAPLSVTDVFATTLEGVEGSPYRGVDLDGRSVLDALQGTGQVARRELGFYDGQEGAENEQVAIRTPQWKLIVRGPDLTRGEPGPEHTLELFAIEEDPEEHFDVAAAHPDVVRELLEKARAYRALQPAESVAPYWEGHEGFVPPKDWHIPAD
jgi:arylsulfatase B